MTGAESNTSDAIAVTGLEHAEGGYLHGLTQPFLQARLRFRLPPQPDWSVVDAAFALVLPHAPPCPAGASDPLAGAIARVLHWTAQLQTSAGDGVFEAGRVLWRAADAAALTVIALPTLDSNTAAQALAVAVALINRGFASPSAQAVVLAAQPGLDDLRERWRLNPASLETMLFLRAAHERQMPWLRLGASWIYQIGYGARAHWVDGAFTEVTPATGAHLARNKAAAASVLRQQGLPAPAHIAVASEEAAVRAAEQLGYPVVVKPVDLDGGVGVRAGVRTAAAVRKAFAEARRHTASILVEAYVEGRDYRLVVLNGRCVWAVERVPGGVIGDGVNTVRALVDQLNADPRRGDHLSISLKTLKLDDEAFELLAEHGMDADSVPACGESVRLRGAANVASGGVPVPALDQVHPDNRRLAERAAAAFRLDIAGVDLIIPDVGRSWREQRAGICEVNGQPSFGVTASGHMYGQILDALVQADGRIPIALIVGETAAAACDLVARCLAAAGLRVGLATPQGVLVAGEILAASSPGVFAGARMLLGDAAVEAAIVAAPDASPAKTGLPFDRCRVIAFAGSRLSGGADGQFRSLAQCLLPMAAAHVVIDAEDDACLALAAQAGDGRVIAYAGDAAAPALAQQRAHGRAAVWVEAGGAAARLVIAPGHGPAMHIPLGGGGPVATKRDIALAGAVAAAMGCSEVHLRQGLAGVSLAS